MGSIHAFNEQFMRDTQARTEREIDRNISVMRSQIDKLRRQIESYQAAIESEIRSAKNADPPRSADISSYRSGIASCERNIQALEQVIAALERTKSDTRSHVERLINTMQTLDMSSAGAMREVQGMYNQFMQSIQQCEDSYQIAKSNMSGSLRKIVGQMASPAIIAMNTSRAAAECYPQLAEVYCGDPVDLLNGSFLWHYTDLSLEGTSPLRFERHYASNMDGRDCGMGGGWSHSFAYRAEMVADTARVFLPQNKPVFFSKGKDGKYELQPKGSYELEKTGDGYLLRNVNGTTVMFDGEGNPASIRELNGSEVKLTCEDGRVTRAQGACGRLELRYEEARLVCVRDHTGRETRYEYDENGNLRAMTNPDGDSLRYTYDENGLLATIVDFNGVEFLKNIYKGGRISEQYVAGQGTSTFRYDEEARKNRFDRRDGYFNEIEYDEKSRITAQTDNAGTHRFRYDDLNRRTADVDKLGRATIYRYAGETGNLIAVLHPDGAMEQFTYNAANQVTTRKTGDGATTVYEYDERGSLARVTDPLKGMRALRYDENNFLVETIDPMGAVTRYERDGKGNALSQTDPLGNVTRYEYDGVGRVTAVADPLGNETRYRYSAAGKLLASADALGGETKRAYTGNGYESRVTDANGNAVVTTYNEVNKPLTVTDPEGHVRSYRYDEAGNRVEETMAEGRKATYAYDELGRVVGVTDPRGNRTAFTYDAIGNMTAKTDPLGRTSRVEYDGRDRAVKAIDERGAQSEAAYDKAGRLVAVKNAMGGEIRYAYDASGNRVSERDANGNATAYEYDAANRLRAVKDALGGVTRCEYDALGRLTAIIRADDATARVAYDAAGNAVSGRDALGGE